MNILTKTGDGSNTFFNEEIGEHYHSSHGALQESRHVFLEAGLKHALAKNNIKEISVLEVGFGTGLNFILSAEYCKENQIKLCYEGIEAYPLPKNAIAETGYEKFVSSTLWDSFLSNYEYAQLKEKSLSAQINLTIATTKLMEFQSKKKFDVLYYDAFSVQHQPEMWTNDTIAHACSFLKEGGVFVSYAITGNLKRAVKACGLTIEKLQGAPGKREMLRANNITV